MNMKRGKRRLLALLLTVSLLLGLTQGALAATTPRADPADQTALENCLGYAREYFRRNSRGPLDMADPNETVYTIVELEAGSVVENYAYALDTNSELAYMLEREVLAEQEPVIDEVEALTGSQVVHQVSYLVNAFSIEMERSQMSQVEELDGVRAVYPVSTVTLDMENAIEMTSVMEMWEAANGPYTGEGIVIAVVDSGTNYSHPDMLFPAGEAPTLKFSESEMRQKIAMLGYGTYYTSKVPFGFSYAGKIDGDVNSTAPMTHGLHVSGIAAATGAAGEEDSVTGVAPGAQIFSMQVFTQDSGLTIDIIRAVEDAVKLGADVINLSLGNTPGFYDDIDLMQRALARAGDQGVLCCCAAGNDGLSSSLTGIDTNDWGVTDTASVSSPSTTPSAISVASADNMFSPTQVISISSNGTPVITDQAVWDFSQGKASDWNDLTGVPLIDCDYGASWDFPWEPPAGGWVALVERGGETNSYDPPYEMVPLTFEDKIRNARVSGASAVIIYNNEASDASLDQAGAGDEDNFRAIGVSGNLGLRLKELAGADTAFTFAGVESRLVRKDRVTMSEFTSWGPTPSLDIKPEITAPGGNIRSVSEGSGYEYMSGTSMATPYVSGAAALILQALKADGDLGIPSYFLDDFVKLSMMNTADPIMDGAVIYPVRQQGAGMIDPAEAAANRVIATYENAASIALGEVGRTTAFTVYLNNYGSEEVTYTLPAPTVYTDETGADGSYYDVAASASIAYRADSVTVPAGGTAEVTGQLMIGDGFPADHYVESYIRFDADDGGISLSLPLLAFYGDWDTVDRIIDLPAWDENNILTNFYADWPDQVAPPYNIATSLASVETYLGTNVNTEDWEIDPEQIAFSPDNDGLADHVFPVIGLLRSPEKLTVEVLDSSGAVCRTLTTLENVGKTRGLDILQDGMVAYLPIDLSNYDYLTGDASNCDGVWDGTLWDAVRGEFVPAPEGQYYIRVTASLPGSRTAEETIMPVKLDVTPPNIEIFDVRMNDDLAYDLEGFEIKYVDIEFSMSDSSGMQDNVFIVFNGMPPEYGIDLTQETFVDEEMGLAYYAKQDPVTGRYTVSLPTWEGEGATFILDGENEVVVMGIDNAYIEGGAVFYSGIDFSETDVVFRNVSGLDTDTVIPEAIVYDGTEPPFRNIRAQIFGVASENVAAITINGVPAEFGQSGIFVAEIPVVSGLNDFVVVASGAHGEELYRLEKQALVDLMEPQIDAYVTDAGHSGELCKDNLYCSYVSSCGNAFATKYTQGDSVPVAVDVMEDGALTELKFTYWTGSMTNEEYNGLMWYLYYTVNPSPYYQPAYPTLANAEMREYDVDPAELVSGTRCLDIPFFSALDYDGSSICMQYLLCQATDAAGKTTSTVIELYGGSYAQGLYAMYGDTFLGEESFDPFEVEELTLAGLDLSWLGTEGYALVPADRVAANGALALTAILPEGVPSILYNGERLDADESGTVQFDVRLNPGVNAIYFYYQKEDGTTAKRSLILFYAPEGSESYLVFDDSEIRNGAVLETTDSTFIMSGEVFSIFGGLNLKINGDLVVYQPGVGGASGSTAHFAKALPLGDGENIVLVEYADSFGEVTSLYFTIVRNREPQLRSYAISYVLDGGRMPGGSFAPTSYTESATAQALYVPVPVRDGYSFLGWTYSGQAYPTMTVALPAYFNGELILTACWQYLTIPAPVFPADPGGGNTGDTNGGESDTTSKPSEELPVTTSDVTESGGTITETTAALESTTRDGVASASVTPEIGREIISQAVRNNSDTVVLAPVMDEDVTKAEVCIPASTANEIASGISASLRVETPIASIAVPNKGLAALAESGTQIEVSAEKANDMISVAVVVDGRRIDQVDGGLMVTVPQTATTAGTVAVLLHDDGTTEVIRQSIAGSDGKSVIVPVDGSVKLAVVDNSKSFSDISASNWAFDAVSFASSHELMNGTGNGAFSPDTAMTRGMLVTVLHNLVNNPRSSVNESFSDVESSTWYTEAVQWAVENRIVNGYGDGSFGPADVITREQLAVMLYRYAGEPTTSDYTLNFVDSDEVSGFARDAIVWAVANGIINGKSGGVLDPLGSATRAEVAQMLLNFMSSRL